MKRFFACLLLLLFLSGCSRAVPNTELKPQDPSDGISAPAAQEPKPEAAPEPAAPEPATSDIAPSDTAPPEDAATELPAGTKQCNVRELIGKEKTIVSSLLLPDGTVAVVASAGEDAASPADNRLSEIDLIDPSANRLLAKIPAGNGQTILLQASGNLFAETVDKDNNVKLYAVKDGALVPLPVSIPKKGLDTELKISPDGTKVAYYGEGDLRVADESGDHILLKGRGIDWTKHDDFRNCYGYKPHLWLDNNRLIYWKVGYEWGLGHGVYDLSTDTDIVLKSGHKYDYIASISGNKAYTIESFDLSFFSTGYFDLSKPDFPWHSLYENPEKKGTVVSFVFSPDGKYCATDDYIDENYSILIYSAVDGSLLKEWITKPVQWMGFIEGNLIGYHSDQTVSLIPHGLS